MSRFVQIDWPMLSADALQGLLEEYVSRDGTDYGLVELSLEQKCQQLLLAVKQKRLSIVFDTETELVDFVSPDTLKELDPK